MPNGSPATSSDVSQLTLTTLGGWAFSYTAPSQAITPVLGPSKPLALLVYLSAMPGHAARREHLADLLWADLGPEAARHALRQTLWALRRRTGTEVVGANGDEIVLHSQVDTDRDAFLAAVETQDHDRAVALYAGDFLPGFAAPGGAEFERWADVERFRLRSTFLRTASALVRLRLDASQFRDAVVLARRVRDTEPASESGWRLLIEALVCAGDRLGAALEADRLGQWLAAEAREPEPKTAAVVRLVTEAEEAAPRSGNALAGTQQLVPEFVGREPEFGAILGAWTEASRGPARHVHIVAPAGLGKTRLLLAVHTRLRATGARTVLLRANPGNRQVSYAFAADVAAALAALPGAAAISTGAADTLVGLCPALSTRYPSARADHGVESELVRRRVLALGELLASVADEAPVAVLIDDTHWADAASRHVLAGAISRLTSERALVVSTARPVAEGAVSYTRTTTLALDPLTVAQVGALVAGLGILPPEPWADRFTERLHAAAGGSPLLVLETLHLALERGTLSMGDDGWRCLDCTALEAMLVEGSAVTYRVAQLAREEMWLLLLLSVAGTPLTRGDIARLAPREGAAADQSLAGLEHRGFVAHSEDRWAPSHDEIGDAALALASPDALRAAHLALGRALEGDAGLDATLLPRAARHLGEAGDVRALDRVVAEWVRHARRRGDRRPLREVLADAIGDDTARVAAAVRRLPLHMRAGLTTPRRIAAAAALVLVPLVAAAALLLRPGTPAPEDELLLASRSPKGDRIEFRTVQLRRADWRSDPVIDVPTVSHHTVIDSAFDWGSGADYSSVRHAWAVTSHLPEPFQQEIYLVNDDSVHRLTTSHGDDVLPSWAPDGSAIAFATARWSKRSWYDIAVIDLATDNVRQITGGDAHDTQPRWSPDGTRIAFLRAYLSQRGVVRPNQICVVSPAGTRQSCFDTPGSDVLSLGGWVDGTSVVAWLQDAGGGNSVALVDVDSRRVALLRRDASGPFVSGDGKWVTAIADAPREMAGATIVFPVEHPAWAAAVRLGGDKSGFSVLWGRTTMARPYLSRLTIVGPSDPLPLSATYRFRAVGLDAAGDTTVLNQLTWRSGDSAIAVLTDSGELVPRRVGPVTVYVTTEGWRRDSLRTSIGQPRFTRVLNETWNDSIGRLWMPFGRPLPTLTRGPGNIPAFFNNGDGIESSGAHTRAVFHGAGGFGAEARFSASVTATQWQVLVMKILAERDSTELAAWDHVEGAPPPKATGSPIPSCDVAFPGGEGPKWAEEVGVLAAGNMEWFPLPSSLLSGRWFRVRLQLFPDGRCGLALDGRPLWISSSILPVQMPIRLFLQGNSSGTRMLVGPVEAWEGVRGDVDWRVLAARPGRRQSKR